MTFPEWATVVAAAVSAIALVVVAYQTYLTRKAVESSRESTRLTAESLETARVSMMAAQRSTDLATRTMQIEMLPKFGWAISVQVQLDTWIQDLEKSRDDCERGFLENDADLLQSVAHRGLSSPSGLIQERSYDLAPPWLQTVWMAAAQYFYDAKALQCHVWDHRDGRPAISHRDSMLRRFDDSLRGLRELRSLLNDAVPQAILDSPASVNDWQFFERSPG